VHRSILRSVGLHDSNVVLLEWTGLRLFERRVSRRSPPVRCSAVYDSTFP